MTKDQATAVMLAGIPVMCRGMQFLRIVGVSTNITDHNTLIDSVALQDRFKRTIYHAPPDEVTMHGEVNGVMYYLDGNEVKATRITGEMRC